MIIDLEFTYDDHFGKPLAKIYINDTLLYDGGIQEKISIDHDVPVGIHHLIIEHHGKEPHQTTQEHDRHFILTKIVLDEINIDQFEHCQISHRAKFYPRYEESYVQDQEKEGIKLPEFIVPNHYFGFNGTWDLEFHYPVAPWVIKEQNPSGLHLEDTIFRSSKSTIKDVKDFFGLDD